MNTNHRDFKQRQYLSVGELAERQNMSKHWVYKMRASGDFIPATRMGGSLRFHILDVIEYEKKARSNSTAD